MSFALSLHALTVSALLSFTTQDPPARLPIRDAQDHANTADAGTLPERDYSNVPPEVYVPHELGERAVQDPAALRAMIGAPDSVQFDDVGDGAIWVLGRDYKARIDAEGLTFVPFLGSLAPQNYPVKFTLRSASIGGQDLALGSGGQPVRDGQRIWVEHGSITEVFDVSLDSIEQGFVVRRGAATGELAVSLAVETELARAANGMGAWFHTPLGAVRYGWAKTLDADGRELGTSSWLGDGAIEFSVPADEVARARGDLTIDPIIATSVPDVSTHDDRDPDVAYDVSNDRYILAFEEVWSQTDHDVFCIMIQGATGQPILNAGGYIDYTWEDWRQISVANMNGADQFLIAGSVGPGPQVIKCRTRSAATSTMGPTITLSGPAAGNVSCTQYPDAINASPVIGGDDWPGSGGFYCVAWIRSLVGPYWGACPDVVFCTVSPTGQVNPAQFLFALGYDGPTVVDGTAASLSISKSDGDPYSGASQGWNLVWKRTSPPDSIFGTRIRWNGVVSHGPTLLVNYGTPLPGIASFWRVYSRISVSTSQSNSSQKFVITWDVVGASGSPRIFGAVVDPSTAWGQLSPASLYDLTTMQSGGPYTQWGPSIDCDGTNFLVAFNGFPGGTKGLGAAEFGWVQILGGWYLVCVEPQVQVAISNQQMGRARMCAESSGGGTRRNMLIGSTLWGGWNSTGYYGGDPFVALHAH